MAVPDSRCFFFVTDSRDNGCVSFFVAGCCNMVSKGATFLVAFPRCFAKFGVVRSSTVVWLWVIKAVTSKHSQL